MTSEKRGTTHEDQGFVLHTTPWRETSLVVEVLTPHNGRISLVAKGVRRPRAALRGVLQPFQPLHLVWYGQEGLRILKSAEWQGGQPLLQGRALFCGFYLNELLFRMVVPEDNQELLFESYGRALFRLALEPTQEPILRTFEYELLQSLGVAPVLDRESLTNLPVVAEVLYGLDRDGAVVRLGPGQENAVQCHGKTLLDMVKGNYGDPRSAQECKRVMRWLLQVHLGGQELHTRRILQEIPTL
ncbi:DNA repair protein RecO [mine drainage metagenome]|uniref:DNA repair protein RecO n=1 Tax=mine drainage metagenome TaxID=410659 RepID=T1D7P2_9ZZZZ